MPRVKSDAERGWIGSWLRRQRTQRGWSPEQVIDRLEQPIRVDYYRGLEAGRKPGPELMAAFEGIYGPMPSEPVKAPTNGADATAMLAALTAAMQAQAEAMREIAEEMRLARATTQARSEGMAAALGDLANTLEQLRLAPLERPTRRQ